MVLRRGSWRRRRQGSPDPAGFKSAGEAAALGRIEAEAERGRWGRAWPMRSGAMPRIVADAQGCSEQGEGAARRGTWATVVNLTRSRRCGRGEEAACSGRRLARTWRGLCQGRRVAGVAGNEGRQDEGLGLAALEVNPDGDGRDGKERTHGGFGRRRPRHQGRAAFISWEWSCGRSMRQVLRRKAERGGALHLFHGARLGDEALGWIDRWVLEAASDEDRGGPWGSAGWWIGSGEIPRKEKAGR